MPSPLAVICQIEGVRPLSAKHKQECMIIVHGLHQDGRPRAAAYGMSSEELAIKAAEKWKLRVGYAVDDAGLALAKEIPSGLQHPFSKVDAPAIKRETYDLLMKVLKDGPPAPPALAPGKDTVGQDLWQAIQPGQTVLWASDPAEGYFHAVVAGISKDGQQLTLRWRDYPKLPEFRARRLAVGLLRQGK